MNSYLSQRPLTKLLTITAMVLTAGCGSSDEGPSTPFAVETPNIADPTAKIIVEEASDEEREYIAKNERQQKGETGIEPLIYMTTFNGVDVEIEFIFGKIPNDRIREARNDPDQEIATNGSGEFQRIISLEGETRAITYEVIPDQSFSSAESTISGIAGSASFDCMKNSDETGMEVPFFPQHQAGAIKVQL